MPLRDLEFELRTQPVPDDVREFLQEAEARMEARIRDRDGRATGFVPCDFVTVYQALRQIAADRIAPGSSFCEWGSGFGVVAGLAAMLDFQSCGIEIDRDLVDASLRLIDDFELPVEFVHGSFVPDGGEETAEATYTENHSDSFWLVTESDGAYDELGLEPQDFDLIFAYPWPGEQQSMESLFERYAADGALLLMYDQFDSVVLRRKVD